MLRAMLSYPFHMTPGAQQHLLDVVDGMYRDAEAAQSWLATLSAKGLYLVQWMGPLQTKIPQAAWTEVSCC
jgi:hypothetical protein